MSPIEARNQILEDFVSAWRITGHEYRADGLAVPAGMPAIPAGNNPWARVTIRHVDGGAVSLPNAFTGKRKNVAVGFIQVSVFAPAGDAYGECYKLAELLLEKFGSIDVNRCVEYRNARIQEVASVTAMSQVNFIADFSYESVR